MILLTDLTYSLGFAGALDFNTFFIDFFLDFIILHFYLWGLMIIIFLSSLFMMLSHGFFSFFKIHDTFEHRFFTLQKNQLILQRSTDHLYINFFPVYLHK
jgi:hypothetical protein